MDGISCLYKRKKKKDYMKKMMDTKKNTNHGGKREGAGRPVTDRNVCITFRTTREAADKLKKLTDNKSMYLTELILKQKS